MKKAILRQGFYKLVSLLLVLSILFAYLSDVQFSVGAKEGETDNTSALQYGIFTGGKTGSLWLNAKQTRITGDIRSNSGITQAGEGLHIDGKAVAAGAWKDLKVSNAETEAGEPSAESPGASDAQPAKDRELTGVKEVKGVKGVKEIKEGLNTIPMPQLFEDILQAVDAKAEHTQQDKLIDQDTIRLDGSIVSQQGIQLYARSKEDKGDSVYYDGYAETAGSLLAEGDIHIYGKTLNAYSGSIIASRTGNIIIHGEHVNITGILYAPNGKVLIHSKSATINGRIYGDSFESQGEVLVVKTGEKDLDLLHAKLQMHIQTEQFILDEKTKNYSYHGKVTALRGTAFSKQGIASITYAIDNRSGHFEGEIEAKEDWRLENPSFVKGINGIKVTVTDGAGESITQTLTLDYQFSGIEEPDSERVQKKNTAAGQFDPLQDLLQAQNSVWKKTYNGTSLQNMHSLMERFSGETRGASYEKTELPKDIVYDIVVEGNTRLTAATTYKDKKVLYTGDLVLDANLTISGESIVYVMGKFVTNTASPVVQGQAVLFVDGDLRNQKLEADGSYGKTEGGVHIKENARVVVKGDLITESKRYTSGKNNYFFLSDYGILELQGDFKALGTDSTFRNTGEGKFIFTGDKEQHVFFERAHQYSYLGKVLIANRMDKIYLDTVVYGVEILSDSTFSGKVIELPGLINSGYHLTIEGDFRPSGELRDSYYVKGNLIGDLTPSFGKSAYAVVEGDLRNQAKQEDGSYGFTEGGVHIKENARVVVKGDLITESKRYTSGKNNYFFLRDYGILELQGDFKALGTDSTFRNTGEGKFIFTGDKEQHVFFERAHQYSYLGKVHVANKMDKIYLDTVVYGVEILSDSIFSGKVIELPGLINSGYHLTIEGDFRPSGELRDSYCVKGDLIGDLTPSFGKSAYAVVEGDLRNQTQREDGSYGKTEGGVHIKENARVVVKGDLITESKRYTSGKNNYFFLNDYGILELQGDFKAFGTDTSFRNTGEGKFIFTGDKEQHVCFERADQYSYLGKVLITNKMDKIYLDTVVYGVEILSDSTLSGKVIELSGLINSGYHLTIEGDFRPSGELRDSYCVKGDLIGDLTPSFGKSAYAVVEGDLRNQTQREDGSYGFSEGAVHIKENAKIVVKGDFITESNRTRLGNFTFYALAGSGVLELQGDFKALGTDTVFRNSGEGKLIFTGSKEQHVFFERADQYSHLGKVLIANKMDKIYLDTVVYGVEILSDSTLSGKVIELPGLINSGYHLTIEGDFRPSGELRDSYYVKGDLIGDLTPSFGKSAYAVVEGDLRNQTQREDGSYGFSEGAVHIKENAKIVVKGDFITESNRTRLGNFTFYALAGSGVLELQGDFKALGTDTVFRNSGEGKIIFAGSKEQHVSFERKTGLSSFGKFLYAKPSGSLYFDTPVYGAEMLADTILSGNVSLEGIQSNGYALTVNGDLVLSGTNNLNGKYYIKRDLIVESGTTNFTNNTYLEVDRDFRVQERTEDGYGPTSGRINPKDNSHIVVKGDFYAQSTSVTYNGIYDHAILELRGNLYQIGTNTYFHGATETAKLVFAGAGEHRVSFERYNNGAQLANVSQTDKNNLIILDSPIWQITAASDLTLYSTSTIIAGINANRHSVKLTNNAELRELLGNTGTVICQRDLTMTGVLAPLMGTVLVEGDLKLTGNGCITTKYRQDKILVNGNFQNEGAQSILENGILEVRKHFIHNTSYNFKAKEDAYVNLTGPVGQKIQIDSIWATVSIHNLVGNKELSQYEYNRVVWVNFFKIPGFSLKQDYIRKSHFGNVGVYAPTGNYGQTFVDLLVPTILGEITLGRTYNSMDEEADSVVGKGFTFSHNMKLISDEEDENVKIIILSNGARNRFQLQSDESYKALNSRDTLQIDNGLYILTKPDQTKYVFYGSGYIRHMEDRKGNMLYFGTDTNGNVTSISDATGTSISISYTNGRISSITNGATNETVTYHYSGEHLVRTVGTAGRTIRYEYNGFGGLLSRIINPKGETAEAITYIETQGDNQYKVRTITDAAGNVKTYYYDTVLGRTTIEDSNGRKEVQKYDAFYSVTSITNDLGLSKDFHYLMEEGYNKYGEVQAEQDFYNNTVSYERDKKGNVTKVSYPDGSFERYYYDVYNNMISSIDKNGATTYYIYEDSGKNLLKIAKPVNGKSYWDPEDTENFTVTEYTYYEIGEDGCRINGLVKTEIPPNGDSRNYIYYRYNRKGQVTEKIVYIDGVPHTTTLTYNSKGLLASERDPEGVVTEYTYDNAYQLLRKKVTSAENQVIAERNVYNELGKIIQKIGPNAYNAAYDNLSADSYSDTTAGIRYTYNKMGLVLSETNSLGHRISYEYDGYGNLLKETLPNGSYKQYTYDAINRKLTTRFYDSATGKLTLLESIVYRHIGAYDEVITTVYIDETQTATVTERYDWAGRLVEKTDAKGNTLRKAYNSMGNVIRETDVFNKNTTYEYDVWGRVISVTAPFEAKAEAQVRYVYDKFGNLLSEETRNNAVSASGISYKKKTYEYDKRGNLLKLAEYSSGEAVRYEQFYYDYKGQVLRHYKGLTEPLTIHGLDNVTANGDTAYTVLKYQYNSLGQVTKTVDGLRQEETFRYDKLGNIVSATDKNGTVTTSGYNSLNQLTSQTATQSGRNSIAKTFTYDNMGNVKTAGENGAVETYTYNGRGELVKEVKGNTVKTYTYNNLGLLLTSTITENGVQKKQTVNTYDNMGRLHTVSENGLLKATYTYDAGSRLTSTKYANGVTETNTYNFAGLVTSVVNKRSNGTVLSSYSYTYSVDGNQLSKTDLTGTTQYVYDGLNRLVKVVNPDGSREFYTFDDNSNRTEKLVENSEGSFRTTYSYDANDQLLRMQEADGTVTTYTYDANGNLTKKVTGDKTVTQEFDLSNRMVKYTDKDTTATYAYNVNNLRASKTVNGSTTRHIWIGDEIQLDIGGSETINYVHGIKLIESSYGTYLYDAHGSVTGLTNSSGQVVTSYEYDPYGIEKITNAGDRNPYRYSGEYLDLESGYVYLRARYYDPSLGRFINMDAVQHGNNWYVYCGNDPVNRIDPSGNEWYHWALAGLAVIGIGAAIVFTAGGITPGLMALGAFASGISTGSAATTILAGSFIAAGSAFAANAMEAGRTTRNVQEFAEAGNWGTVVSTGVGGIIGAGIAGLSVAADRYAQRKYEASQKGLYRKTGNTGEFSELSEPMQLKHVKRVAKNAGIDYSGTKIKIVRNGEMIGKDIYGWTSPNGKTVHLYPDAFTSRAELVKTLGHERIHVYQTQIFGSPTFDTIKAYETAARLTEESWWEFYRFIMNRR